MNHLLNRYMEPLTEKYLSSITVGAGSIDQAHSEMNKTESFSLIQLINIVSLLNKAS